MNRFSSSSDRLRISSTRLTEHRGRLLPLQVCPRASSFFRKCYDNCSADVVRYKAILIVFSHRARPVEAPISASQRNDLRTIAE